MPIVKRYTFQPRISAGLASQLNTNYDDIIDAFNAHTHTGVGTDAPNINISGIANNTLTLNNPYKFSAYRNAAWTTTAGLAKVNFDAENFDTNSNFDSTTNFYYTAPVSGFYQFNSNVSITGGATRLGLFLYKNAITEVARNDTNISNATATVYSCAVSALVQLTAGDTMQVSHAASAAIGGGTGQTTVFSGFLVCRL